MSGQLTRKERRKADGTTPKALEPSMQAAARVWPRERVTMWLGIAVLLLVLWAGGFFMFHVAGFLIHILLILAVVSFIIQFVAGRKAA